MIHNIYWNSSRFSSREVFSLEFETDKCIFFSGVVCSFRAREANFTLSVDGRTLATSEPVGCDYMLRYTFDTHGHCNGSAAIKLDLPVLVQAHRKYKLSVTAKDAVGTQTRRVTQVIGREEREKLRRGPRHGESRVRHEGEPVHFTLTYGDTRCVFAELLYRNVDDTIYGV
ncbi:hypothetical protein AAVH_28387 [Aphelenchoides avenae]|nr:hypothetical protein AAVH_28387 [Aphelenchus avenae]